MARTKIRKNLKMAINASCAAAPVTGVGLGVTDRALPSGGTGPAVVVPDAAAVGGTATGIEGVPVDVEDGAAVAGVGAGVTGVGVGVTDGAAVVGDAVAVGHCTGFAVGVADVGVCVGDSPGVALAGEGAAGQVPFSASMNASMNEGLASTVTVTGLDSTASTTMATRSKV